MSAESTFGWTFAPISGCSCLWLSGFASLQGRSSLGEIVLEHKKLKFRTMAKTAWKDYCRTNLSFSVCCLCSKQEYIYLNCFSENCTVSRHSEEVSFKFWQSWFLFFFPQGGGKGSLHWNHKWNLCTCTGSAPNLVFWVCYHSDVELKTILASNSPPKVYFLLWLYFATLSLFLRTINTGDGLVALCPPDQWLKMSVLGAVNKSEVESLSFTEQNIINESELLWQFSSLWREFSIELCLFPCSGGDLLVHCYCCNGSTGNMNTHTTCDCFFTYNWKMRTLKMDCRSRQEWFWYLDLSTTAPPLYMCGKGVFLIVVKYFFKNFLILTH